jgi:3-oxoacyl-[acyl-carrier protein] reductase
VNAGADSADHRDPTSGRPARSGEPMRFTGRTAVITGAAAGIGRGYAQAFAREGATVVVADVDDVGAAETVALISEDGGRAVAVRVDVTDEAQVAAMVEAAVEASGRLDILVNNAARHLGRTHENLTIPADEWRRILDVNVVGPVICTQACRQVMAAQGGGVVVNQSSVAAYVAAGGAYGVSKLALNRFTMAAAAELAPEGIRVIGIAPGMVASDAVLAHLDDAMAQHTLGLQMIRRVGQVADCVAAVLFLCSDEASFITGHTISVDGGYAPHP